MKKILIALAIFALLAIQAQACFGNICPPGGIKPPSIPINLHKPLPLPLLPPPNCFFPKPQPQPQPQPPVCRDEPLSNKFTLSLSYACRPGVAFQSCLGEVVWNNAIVSSIVPCDYKFQTLNLEVTAQVGKNVLQLIGAGTSDSFGLLIDNVRLVRKGTNQNIVVNGDFSHPNVGQSWGIFNNILGWEGKGIEVGFGPKAYGAGHEQLCELDGDANYLISQEFTFNNEYRQVDNKKDCDDDRKPLKFTLEFDWAIRESNTNPESSKANVIWNDVVVASLDSSKGSRVNHASIAVDLKAGDNVLQFDGTSFSDAFGITVDNVELTSKFSSKNLIENGDFNSPCVGSGWSYFKGGIPGWAAVLAEVGDGKNNYNCNWRSGQVLELDSESNQRYTQVVKISDSLYS